MKKKHSVLFVCFLLFMFAASTTLSIHPAAAVASQSPNALPGAFNKLAPFINETGASTKPTLRSNAF